MGFNQKVFEAIQLIPVGRVATYGQIASIVGSPRAARQVGFALRGLGLNDQKIPWWRVVNKQGYISINHGDGGIEKEIQRDNLLAEGVEVKDDYTIDLNKYLWK